MKIKMFAKALRSPLVNLLKLLELKEWIHLFLHWSLQWMITNGELGKLYFRLSFSLHCRECWYLFSFFRALRNLDAFVKMIEPIFIFYLKDRAAEVRELGLSKIPELISVYNMQWAIGSFLPKILETLNKENGFVTHSIIWIKIVVPNDCNIFDLTNWVDSFKWCDCR